MTSRTSAALSATALCAALATPAFAGPTYENASGGSVTFYGQFNPSYLSFDDGGTTTNTFADNAASNTRVGFLLRQPFGENELRFRFESGLGLRPTSGISQTMTPGGIEWDRTDLRHVDLQFETARAGTFYFGQGSMASDGIGDRSLSGTGLATSVSIGDIAGGFELRTTGGALSGIQIGDAFANLDGSRRGRIRYDTPNFSGFTLSVAYGQDILTRGNSDDFYDVGLGYEAEISGGMEIEAGLGYQVRERDGSPDREDVFGSITVAMPSGFNATFAAGDRNTGGDYHYAKFGYRMNVLPIGETAVSIDYYSGSDFVSLGDDAESFGIGIVQDFDNHNIEAYFGYRQYSYDDVSATSYQDAQSVVLGARISF
ncbi:porin [Aestuariivita boseongensis]|uniref:porin n=1 Tax=Aestuariivita boseongensis TaxID=1470562 RepID=UPI000681EABA|nr:porin [Aestuariivita boseongensis]